MNTENFWIIVTILLGILGVSLLIYAVRELIQLKKVGALQINRKTQISWELGKELPENLNIYTSTADEDYTVYQNILKYCGFDTNLGFFQGAKFDNENWWVECDGEEVSFHSKKRNTGKEMQLSIDEAKTLAMTFLTNLGIDMSENYTYLGHTYGDGLCILIWGQLFDGKYAADFPHAIEIGFFEDKSLAYISVDLEKVVVSGIVKTTSFDKLKQMVHNLKWYSSVRTIHEIGQIEKLRIMDYEITYSQIGDNRYLPYIRFFGEVNLYDNVAIEVSSEPFLAYKGRISKITSESRIEAENISRISQTINEALTNDAAKAYFRLAVMQKEKGEMSEAIESIEKSVAYLNEVQNSELLTDVLKLAVELYETVNSQEHARCCRERLKKTSNKNKTDKGENQQ